MNGCGLYHHHGNHHHSCCWRDLCPLLPLPLPYPFREEFGHVTTTRASCCRGHGQPPGQVTTGHVTCCCHCCCCCCVETGHMTCGVTTTDHVTCETGHVIRETRKKRRDGSWRPHETTALGRGSCHHPGDHVILRASLALRGGAFRTRRRRRTEEGSSWKTEEWCWHSCAYH